jgi:cell division protein FtsW
MSIASADFNNPFYFFTRHLIYVLMAVTAATIAANMPMQFWQRWMAYFICARCYWFGANAIRSRINGSARWIGLGL